MVVLIRISDRSLTGRMLLVEMVNIVHKPSHDIDIKTRATADPLLPMSSVPHDWSWSTF
ncbi:hypothetical protein BGZ59_007908 [Podila verticillata]|nr:hypothetical protein BGZ59_007908 [Podila verticillata]